MPATSITDYFRRLNAPLHNSRWSWGSVREADQALFLRVWGDESIGEGDLRYYRLTAYSTFESKPKDLGWLERQRHLALLQDPDRSAPTYMVICTAKDTAAEPRSIADFDSQTLFLGGDLIQHEGDWWLQARNRVEAYDARQIGSHTDTSESEDPSPSARQIGSQAESSKGEGSRLLEAARAGKALADLFHTPAEEPKSDTPR
jgi:hypothetical protein